MKKIHIPEAVIDLAVTLYLKPKLTWVSVSEDLKKQGHCHDINILKKRCYASSRMMIAAGYSRCPICKDVHQLYTKKKVARCGKKECQSTKVKTLDERMAEVRPNAESLSHKMATRLWTGQFI